MQIEFDEDDDTRNALLSPSSGPPLAEQFVPVGQYTEAIVMRLQGGLPSIRCGRPREEIATVRVDQVQGGNPAN